MKEFGVGCGFEVVPQRVRLRHDGSKEGIGVSLAHDARGSVGATLFMEELELFE